MKRFTKFIFLYEDTKINQNENQSVYLQNKPKLEDKFWEKTHEFKKDDWNFIIGPLGGQRAKGQQDLTITHNVYFKEPVNIELKSFRSKLVYSNTADDIMENAKKASEGALSFSKQKARTKISPDDHIIHLKQILKHSDIVVPENSSPTDILSLYREHKAKLKLTGEDVHVPPISTHVLEQIEQHYRDNKTHGIFMSSGLEKNHAEEHKISEDMPVSYKKAYNQVHDIINEITEWKPNSKKTGGAHESNSRTKMWTTEENGEHNLSEHNQGVSLINNLEYVKHEDGDFVYFAPSHFFKKNEDDTFEINDADGFNEWKKLKRSVIYKKRKDGTFVRGKHTEGKEGFIEHEKKKPKSLDEMEKHFQTIRRRSNSIGLHTEAKDNIKSGFDVNSSKSLVHQFLDHMYGKTQNKK